MNKSSDIPIVLLKRCSQIILPILSKFYNLFMCSGTFPVILKTGIVSPKPSIQKRKPAAI